MASAVATAELAILARINTQWGTTTDIAWPNMPLKPPDDDYWLRVDIVWGDGFIETMETTGSNRLYGFVQLTVFGPKGEGLGGILGYVDTARDVLNRWTGSGVRFDATSGPKVVDDEQYTARAVSTPFNVVDV